MSNKPFHVVIAGGGVAALECLLALRELAPDRVSFTVISPEPAFLYRPVTVGEAFDRSQARAYPLIELVQDDLDSRLVTGAVGEVRADAHTVLTLAGEAITYDALVVATGALPHSWLPGALTFAGRAEVPALRELLDDLVTGHAASVALALPSERIWSLPLYELALMTAEHLREFGSESTVHVVTPEDRPLALFGPPAGRAIEAMLRDRGIILRTSVRPKAIQGRALVLEGSGAVWCDRVIALPELDGPRIPGLPHDERGFIPTDSFGRVLGLRGVFAAGDATTFPLKQGGLAAQQADAVAETIASELGLPVQPHPFTSVLRGLLMTSGAPLYLRAEPQRLPRETSVAIEASARRRPQVGSAAVAHQPLWWPPAKIAGRHLGPALATARPRLLAPELLADRVPFPGPAQPGAAERDYKEALDLALMLADCDARWGDFTGALAALGAAQAIAGALPPDYERKRAEWARWRSR